MAPSVPMVYLKLILLLWWASSDAVVTNLPAYILHGDTGTVVKSDILQWAPTNGLDLSLHKMAVANGLAVVATDDGKLTEASVLICRARINGNYLIGYYQPTNGTQKPLCLVPTQENILAKFKQFALLINNGPLHYIQWVLKNNATNSTPEGAVAAGDETSSIFVGRNPYVEKEVTAINALSHMLGWYSLESQSFTLTDSEQHAFSSGKGEILVEVRPSAKIKEGDVGTKSYEQLLREHGIEEREEVNDSLLGGKYNLKDKDIDLSDDLTGKRSYEQFGKDAADDDDDDEDGSSTVVMGWMIALLVPLIPALCF